MLNKSISILYVMLRVIKFLLIQLTTFLFDKIALISLNFYIIMVFQININKQHRAQTNPLKLLLNTSASGVIPTKPPTIQHEAIPSLILFVVIIR